MPSHREKLDLVNARLKGDKNMRSIAPHSSRLIWRPRTATCGMYSQQGVVIRFRYFVEGTNWDEVLLHRVKWFDKLCIGCIIFSVLYFIPILVVSMLR